MHRLLVAAVVMLIAPLSASATVYYVDSAQANNTGTGTSWTTAKKDMQAAINVAVTGDHVWVKAGTYLPTMDGTGNASPTNNRHKVFYLTNKDLKVYGGFAGGETILSQRNAAVNVTILSGDLDGPSGTADAYHVIATSGCTAVCVLDGFTISGGRTSSASDGGMYNSNSSPSISNCIFSGNTAYAYGGGMYNDYSNPLVSTCTFSNNTSAAMAAVAACITTAVVPRSVIATSAATQPAVPAVAAEYAITAAAIPQCETASSAAIRPPAAVVSTIPTAAVHRSAAASLMVTQPAITAAAYTAAAVAQKWSTARSTATATASMAAAYIITTAVQ